MPVTVYYGNASTPYHSLVLRLLRGVLTLTALLCLLFSVSAHAEKVVTPSPQGPVALKDDLVKVSPPAEIVRHRSAAPGETWYRLNLAMPKNQYPDWLLVFRRTPHQQLDIFMPRGQVYEMVSAGSLSSSRTSDPRAIKLKLSAGQTHSLYLRVNSPTPNQLTPALWPEPLYTLQEYKSRSLISVLEALVILFLLVTAIIAMVSHQQNYLLLTAHLLATTTLVVMWQGDIFRNISWAGDPGLWVMIMTAASLISAIACYGNLGLVALYSPLSERAVLWLGLLAGGAIAGYPLIGNDQTELINIGFILILSSSLIMTLSLASILSSGLKFARLVLPTMVAIYTALFILWNQSPWPRAVITENELTLICLQSLLITGLYWVNRQQKHRQAISVNRVVTFKQNRRIFDQALRDHLQAPANEPMDERSIGRRILETLDSVVPGMPSMLLTRHHKTWSIKSYYPKAAQRLKSQMNDLSAEFVDIINSGGEDQISLEGQGNLSYWVQLLHSEKSHHTLLIVNPGRHTRKSIKWQYILDISSHARTLFQASQQARYWKLQASLDPLTQCLNRRAFTAEAEKRLTIEAKKLVQSCLIFIDLDNFKQINDRFGHPAGDKVLSSVAGQLRKVLRQKDLSGRFGGEEFVVLLPGTEALQGVKIAERIRQAFSAIHDAPVKITASLGIAATTPNTYSLTQLTQEADQALYKAKKQGKNRVVRAPSCQDLRLPEPDLSEQ